MLYVLGISVVAVHRLWLSTSSTQDSLSGSNSLTATNNIPATTLMPRTYSIQTLHPRREARANPLTSSSLKLLHQAISLNTARWRLPNAQR